MKERAAKPKQPVKHRKKTTKSVKTDMPQSNSAAEAAIFIGSLGLALYAVFVFMMALVASAFNDTGRKGMEFVSLVLILFGINIAIQSSRVSKEKHRIDRYGQRIFAIYMIFLPFLGFSAGTMIISVISSAYLWFLLTREDKIYDKRSKSKRARKR